MEKENIAPKKEITTEASSHRNQPSQLPSSADKEAHGSAKSIVFHDIQTQDHACIPEVVLVTIKVLPLIWSMIADVTYIPYSLCLKHLVIRRN